MIDVARSVGRLAAMLVGLGLLGCGGKNEPIPPLWVGPSSQAVPAQYADGYYVLASVDGSAAAWAVLDTGAPFSLLQSQAFNLGPRSGMSDVAALSIGDVTVWRASSYFVSGSTSETIQGRPFGGIVGYSAFGGLRLSFDPQAHSVGFGATSLPPGVDSDGTSTSFSVRGGGTATSGFASIKIPTSRIIVSAEIEGQTLRLLFDTGASTVTLAPAAFSAIVNDGRPTVTTRLTTLSGSGPATAARVSSLSAIGQTTSGTLVMSSDAINPLLDQLQKEIGEPIDGMLGHSFLREFLTVVDYPKGRITLYRFVNDDYVLDDFRRVGLSLSWQDGTSSVETVFPGTAAEAQGVQPGEVVTAIDGVSTSDLGPIDSELALRGVVGSTRTIAFGSVTRVLPIEDLLPSP